MDRYNKDLGDRGERAAALYLMLRGYKVLERNYRRAHGEVDIIVGRGKTIAFVEVKTRTGDDYGTPAEAVAYTKKQRLISAAQHYAMRFQDYDLRFDIIEVYANINNKRIKRINHIKNAFHL